MTHKTTDATGYIYMASRRYGELLPSLSGAAFSLRAKWHKVNWDRVDVDDFVMEALKRTVHHIYREKKYPTLNCSCKLTYKDFDQVTTEQWKKLIDHVRQDFEERYWHDDSLQEEGIDEFIIRVGGSDDEASNGSSESRVESSSEND